MDQDYTTEIEAEAKINEIQDTIFKKFDKITNENDFNDMIK